MENNTQVVIEQQDENKKRGAFAVILAIAFVAILGIGGTFAYLTYTANQAANRFTTDVNITADLYEPAWTSAVTTASDKGVASDGSTVIPDAANNMMAGSKVGKDPYIVNTSKVGNETTGGPDEYAGIKLTFQKWVASAASDGTETGKYVNMTADEVKALLAVYSITSADITDATTAGLTIGDGWKGVSSTGANATYTSDNYAAEMYFVYTNAIKAIGSTTKPDAGATGATSALFKNVYYTKTATSTQVKALNDALKKGANGTGTNLTKDPGWRVVVSAAVIEAVSGETLDTTHAKSIVDSFGTMTDGAVSTESTRTQDKGSGWLSAQDVPTDHWTY